MSGTVSTVSLACEFTMLESIGVCLLQRNQAGETVETVPEPSREPNTQLKLGVNEKGITRRALMQGLGAAACGLLGSLAGCRGGVSSEGKCAPIHGRRVRWLVGYGPGGGYDIYSRLLQPHLEKHLGVQIVVENMPGGGGILSAGTLSRSNPDGLTLGIINGPGLLVAAMTGEANVPNPATDLALVGRIARNRTVICAPAGSKLETIEDVLRESKSRPLLFSTSEIGSTNFVGVVVTSSLLGLECDFVPGYSGSRESVIAMLRGESDLVSNTFESVLDHIEAGDIKPLLQISAERIAAHSSLDAVPLLAGDEGLAARRAGEIARALPGFRPPNPRLR